MTLKDYPTFQELKTIKKWDYTQDFHKLMDFIQSIWWMPDWGFRKTQRRYYLSTGGWSGNEDILMAMKNNFMFWSLAFYQCRRGGHYIFEIRKIKHNQKGIKMTTLKGYPEKKEGLKKHTFTLDYRNGFDEAVDLFTKEIIRRSELSEIESVIKKFMLQNNLERYSLSEAIQTLFREGK